MCLEMCLNISHRNVFRNAFDKLLVIEMCLINNKSEMW